jgi:mannose-6-phosphate isomerase-like protein (cupin superfamily)
MLRRRRSAKRDGLRVATDQSMQTISRHTAEHYTWGGPHRSQCDGWHLVKTPELSIIEELMPPGASEVRHFHERARQFFFVLEGELTLEVEHREFVVRAHDGLEIPPGQAHQARNRSAHGVRFLVTSQPPSHGDRVEV